MLSFICFPELLQWEYYFQLWKHTLKSCLGLKCKSCFIIPSQHLLVHTTKGTTQFSLTCRLCLWQYWYHKLQLNHWIIYPLLSKQANAFTCKQGNRHNTRKLLPRTTFSTRFPQSVLTLSQMPFPAMPFLELVLNRGKLQPCTGHTATAVCVIVPSVRITFTCLVFPCLNSQNNNMVVLGLINLVLASSFYSAVKHELFVYKWTGSASTNRIPCQIPCAFILLKEQKKKRWQNIPEQLHSPSMFESLPPFC